MKAFISPEQAALDTRRRAISGGPTLEKSYDPEDVKSAGLLAATGLAKGTGIGVTEQTPEAIEPAGDALDFIPMEKMAVAAGKGLMAAKGAGMAFPMFAGALKKRGSQIIEKEGLAGFDRLSSVASKDQFEALARTGKMNQATGRYYPGEDKAKTPISVGLINKYPPEDIAHFYTKRAGGNVDVGFDDFMSDLAKERGAQVAEKEIGGLAMDEASRIARAKEMGFDTDKTWYHGTGSDIQEFKNNPKGINKYGEGIYLTPNKGEASYYASMGRAEAPNVLPLKIRSENPVKLNDPNEVNKVYEALGIEKMPLPKAMWRGFADEWNEFNQLLSSYAKNKGVNVKKAKGLLFEDLKKAGYTGMSAPGDTIETVFEPSQIRSKFATFDPKKKNFGNISAGLGAAAGGGLLLKNSDDNSNY